MIHLVPVSTVLVAAGFFAPFSTANAQESRQNSPGERVPDAAVVSGVPQGMFVGRSLLTGRAVCLLFLSGGRVTRSIPAGGLEHLDWERHQAAHPGNTGRWRLVGGELQITWGDGGVHQGPLTETQNGVEFHGKRYARTAVVKLPAIAGRWESSRGTAIVGGEGINVLNTLVIQADGRYRWTAATGGVVAGRAAADIEPARSGRCEISGTTISFHADDGTTTSHTFLPVAGSPVMAFSLDANMFTRVE